MPFPIYLPTRVIRFGGATGQTSGELLYTKVVVTSDRSLVHNETGYRFEQDSFEQVSSLGGEASLTLPCTDTAGMRDAETGSIIDVSVLNSFTHRYTAQISFTNISGKATKKGYTVGPFVLPLSDGSVLDGDTQLIGAAVSSGQLVLIPDIWSSYLQRLDDIEDLSVRFTEGLQ